MPRPSAFNISSESIDELLRKRDQEKDNSSAVMNALGAVAATGMSIATANPGPLMAYTAAKAAGAVTGSDTIGALAGAAVGDPSEIGKRVVEKGKDIAVAKAIGAVDPTGTLSTAKSAFDTTKSAYNTNIAEEEPTSAFQKMLPLAPILGGVVNKAMGGRFSTGMQMGNMALEGMSTVQKMQQSKKIQDMKISESKATIAKINQEMAASNKPVGFDELPLMAFLQDGPFKNKLKKSFSAIAGPTGEARTIDVGNWMKGVSQIDDMNEGIKSGISSYFDADITKQQEVLNKLRYKTDPKSKERFIAETQIMENMRATKKSTLGEIDNFTKNNRELEAIKNKLKAEQASAVEKEKIFKKQGLGSYGDKKKTGKSYQLPDSSIVNSYDGGQTYKAKDGTSPEMPHNAVAIPGGASMTELKISQAKAQADQTTKQLQPTTPETGVSAEEAALGGTGPWASLQALTDSIAGGVLGIDKLLGTEGLFPETQENRLMLRNIKQMGKTALMNSSRGAIWEQEKIDKLFPNPDTIWTNPRTEAKKFPIMRKELKKEKEFNNKAIQTSSSMKEIEKYRGSNYEIDKLLSLIGEKGQSTEDLISPEDRALINKYKR